MLLVIDTSTAACTTALFDEAGTCLASRGEVIGRGHAERLVPMIEELMAGRRASQILVGVGPGSFTGVRVGIAAAHGLAIGWNAEVSGLSSLALLAAGTEAEGDIAAAMQGACQGCPSSAITLKRGIESLIRHYVPEVETVEAV